jgi:4-hydroxy-4-methyl-2-oxoglutarate aldolase
MAELADAQDLGSCIRKGVGVRPSLGPPVMPKKISSVAALSLIVLGVGFFSRSRAADVDTNLSESFRMVEVASVADAIEQLYGQRAYMSHEMRPLSPTKFAGPAVTVLMKREENTDGANGIKGVLDAIDHAPAGSVYVMELQDGADFAGIGGLMTTAMKARGLAGAIVDGGVRDTPQIQKLQFPVFSRGVVPSTTVNHYRFAGMNVPIHCAGVAVNAGDIVSADLDGVVVIPKAKAAEILKKSQDLDNSEHTMLPFIEKYKSIGEAVKKFGRI